MLKRYAYKRARMRQTSGLRNVYALLLLTLLFFVILLAGCGATLPTVPPAQVRIPEPPPPTMQQPQEPYQQSVLTLLQRWRDKLTDGATKP